MRLLFCRSRLPGSYLIRGLTFSAWSHVTLIDGDTAWEATWPAGVRRVPTARVLATHSAWQIAEIQVPRPADALAFLDRQRGRRYDTSALFGLALGRREWDEPDAWFCSELVAAALNAGGAELFRDAWRVTPQMLFLVAR